MQFFLFFNVVICFVLFMLKLYLFFNNIEGKNNFEDDVDKLFKCISYLGIFLYFCYCSINKIFVLMLRRMLCI